jgi:hypothetical protein
VPDPERLEVNRPRITIDPSDLVLEIISIVVAILLALAVNYLGSQVKTHEDVANALAAIGAELAANEALVVRVHPHHLAKCSALQALARRGRGRRITYTAYQNTLDAVLPFTTPGVQSTAWELAQSSGISANFDYATRSDIAHVYAQQQSFVQIGRDLALDFRPLVFERDGDFFLAARNAAFDCTAVTSGEDRLSATYRTEIAKLR